MKWSCSLKDAICQTSQMKGFPSGSASKESVCNVGDLGLIPGLGRSPGGGRDSSVQFSRPVVSNSLWPHGLQHARPPCPSSTPGIYPNSCPLSWWCHPTISSSVVPFSFCLQFFPASGNDASQWVGSSYQVAKLLGLQFQHHSFQWIFRIDFL